MPAAVRPGPAAVELPEEFAGPVAYSDRWLWIALVLAVLVLLYYAAAWWLTRPRQGPAAPTDVEAPDARREHLDRIDRIEDEVRTGSLSPRGGHQELSDVVRSYVASVTTLPARTMALADFRARAPKELVDAIELMYPPEFAPDDVVARDRFDDALGQARALVTTWS
ncbi:MULTISPECIES: hypothetical protein [Nocardioides]|uniref:DUF4129 domain-containing protein n=1 Tax=Nocardioides vastitatis TaxID=2568655 RepID=A0ABW0ZHA3_9ACTN|nr:hypothetical protein [Nocardioides sp.]THJ15098.1 hypothetical protein E7Z54_00795 [Nocardioides sp.]